MCYEYQDTIKIICMEKEKFDNCKRKILPYVVDIRNKKKSLKTMVSLAESH